jgi:hypothetical protein
MGYRPFVPLENTLSRSIGVVESDEEPEPLHEIPQPAPVETAPPVRQKGLLEGLLGLGGNKNRQHSGQSNGSILGNLASGDTLGSIAGLLRSGGGGISKILNNFSIEWDSGDILLALILLFLSLESDDDEILILLGLMLVMGF